MESTDDSRLLRQYAENGADDAFAEIVLRHINLVYSVALRRVGNSHHAEEITQAVFIILSKKAASLRHEKALSSWLFQATRLTANNFARSEARRQRREQEAYMQSTINHSGSDAWERIGPMLDDAVGALSEQERQAIILRFYEGRNSQEVAVALGTSEAAAKKRVTRAVEKLQRFFSKRGVASTTAIIPGIISANSVQAAPAALTKFITLTAAKGATATGSTLTLAKGALKLMAWTKAKMAIVGALVAVVVATTTVTTVKHFSKSHGSVEVSIINHSSLTISNVSLNSDHFGIVGFPMTPGMSVRLLYPTDSRGWLYFEANGQKIDSRGKNFTDYITFTSRQPLSFQIGADLKVTSSSGR